MQRLFFILFYFLLLFPSSIVARQQNYIFQHLTTKDGLASDKVNNIFQDSRGYYWIKTENRLQKFDGANFISMPLENQYKISDILWWPSINSVEDTAGSIWVFNQGIIYIYRINGRVDTIAINEDTNDSISDIVAFCKDE